MFAANSAPAGYLICNGTDVSRSTYANLFAVIGTTYGAGNGSTTFNLPNFLGYFPRGYDSTGAVDPGRVFGSLQANSLQSHTHPLSDPGHNHTTYHQSVRAGNTGNYWDALMNGLNASSGGAGTNPSGTTGSGTLGAGTGITIGNTGGSETRPNNIAITFCIKY